MTKFPSAPNEEVALEYCQTNFGSFAWIYEDKEEIVACTDTIRSFPLFYFFDGHQFAISDDSNVLRDVLKLEALNRDAFESFTALGYTLGNETLLEDVFVLQPGEYLCFSKSKKHLKVKTYIEIGSNLVSDKTKSQTLLESLKSTIDNIFNDVVLQLKEKTAIIPLSGGHDSRLILAALAQRNFKSIICYTYGKPDSFEVKAAREITKRLNVKWHFIPYSKEVFQTYLLPAGMDYERFASQNVSIAHEQDFFAVQHLKNNKLLPENSVFLPGFCADVLAGSLIQTSVFKRKYHDHLNFILENYFPSEYEPSESLVQHIAQDIKPIANRDQEQWQISYENWYTRNKLTKFVTNAVRCYEFAGFHWILPYWDLRFVQFWQQVPFKERKNRKLYFQCLKTEFFEPLDIDIQVNHIDKALSESKLLGPLKDLAPKQMKNMVKSALGIKNKKDVNNLNVFAEVLIQDEPTLKGNFYNENQVHAAWLVHKLQNRKKPFPR